MSGDVDNIIPLVSQAYAERLAHRRASPHVGLFDLLEQVKDPEIPVLSIWDLGILRDATVTDSGVEVTITPTYSGCPAMSMIAEQVEEVLRGAGYNSVNVVSRLSPAWTTDWMAPDARTRLREYGIAPPESAACPNCGSNDTEVVSEFGSTACKALYKCRQCLEPFDHFKHL